MPSEMSERSLYDREIPEEDLWFLPPAPDEAELAGAPQPSDHRALTQWQRWRAAEQAQGRALAEAAAELARLDERTARLGGAPARLAIEEVAAMTWAEGQRLPAERIALHAVLRLSASSADHRDLALAQWARQRLTDTSDPLQPESFLGRRPVAQDGLGDWSQRPVGEEFRALSNHWRAAVIAADLHPITRAAFAYHLWRKLELSGPEGVLEPATIAERIGAGGQSALSFMPVALAGVRGLMAAGPPEARLGLWFQAVTRAARAARLELAKLETWQWRCQEETADLSGKTPPALIRALMATPVLSARMAERLTGASRAAVQRNLGLFVRRGLAREITGQSRYRFWTVAL